MTTREVAEYLRIKERKVYDLVRDKRIPCTRVTGKWLFPKHLIDHWLATGTEFPDRAAALEPTPAVCAGSHDPLLEWCLRESGCEVKSTHAFDDHHPFTRIDLDYLRADAESLNARLVTTEKDAARLSPEDLETISVLTMSLDWADETSLDATLSPLFSD